MDIIFTGGACEDTKFFQNYDTKLLKNYDKKFSKSLDIGNLENNLSASKKNGEDKSETITPKYSNKVLTGNWYEDRIIVPARSSDEWITDYNTHYKTHHLKDPTEEAYTIWKNKQNVQGWGEKLAIDGDSFMDNMTTSYDLSFRILPKESSGPRVRVYKKRTNTWEPEKEFDVSYGNQTNYGLVDAIKLPEVEDDEAFEVFKTTYQIDYTEQIPQKDANEKRFLKPRLDFNTPDLRHLGIDLSSESSLIIREPRYRRSLCKKICTWL